MTPRSIDTMTIETRARALRAAYTREALSRFGLWLRQIALRPARA
ncbi:MAG: hypothetical protein AAF919_02035 [Pseudomonadota bacterium]